MVVTYSNFFFLLMWRKLHQPFTECLHGPRSLRSSTSWAFGAITPFCVHRHTARPELIKRKEKTAARVINGVSECVRTERFLMSSPDVFHQIFIKFLIKSKRSEMCSVCEIVMESNCRNTQGEKNIMTKINK